MERLVQDNNNKRVLPATCPHLHKQEQEQEQEQVRELKLPSD